MEDTKTEKLVRKGIEDARQWVAEASTPVQLGYRLDLVIEAFSGKGKIDFHYYIDGPAASKETQ